MRFGREIYKLSGSGNDFVFLDCRLVPAGELAQPAAVAAICARATGVGADGIVFLETSAAAAYRIRYLNRDGSVAALCGNAALCSARLALELGAVDRSGFSIETDAGVLAARVLADLPEIELAAPGRLQPMVPEIAMQGDEQQLGYVEVGVPHLVVLCDDTDAVDVGGRGRALRSHPALQRGANVNFVARDGAEWRVRTYERGVEAETLACGTGAAACAVLLATWGLAGPEVRLRARSGSILEVGLPDAQAAPRFEGRFRLRGAARIVFRGRLGEVIGVGLP